MAVNPVSGTRLRHATPRRATRCASRGRASSAARTVQGHLHESAHHRARRRQRHAAPPEQAHRLRARVPRPPGVKAAQPRDAGRHGGDRRRRDALRRGLRLEQGRRLRHRRARERHLHARARRPHRASAAAARAASCSTRRATALYVLHALRQRGLGGRPRHADGDRAPAGATTPSPPSVVDGRPFLYDAALTSSNGEASCASCHIFGDLDSLAWDLGNPDDEPSTTEPELPFRVAGGRHRLPPDEGADDDAEPARHGEPRRRCTGAATAPAATTRRRRVRRGRWRSTTFNPAFVGPARPRRASSTDGRDAGVHRLHPPRSRYPPNPIRASTTRSPTDAAGRPQPLLRRAITDARRSTATAATPLDPRAGLLRQRRLRDLRGRDADRSRSRTCATSTRRSACSACRRAGHRAGDNGHQGAADARLRLPARRQRRHRLPLPRRDACSQPRRDAEQRRARAVHARLRHRTWRRSSASRSRCTSTQRARRSDPRIDLLIARARRPPGECDLVVKGTVAGEARGAWLTPAAAFQTDRAGEALLTDAALRALAATAGQELTYTCVPPGSGARIGVDRDEDGFFDRDELDAGSDPADPTSFPGALAPTASAPRRSRCATTTPHRSTRTGARCRSAPPSTGHVAERRGGAGVEQQPAIPHRGRRVPDRLRRRRRRRRRSSSPCRRSAGSAPARRASPGYRYSDPQRLNGPDHRGDPAQRQAEPRAARATTSSRWPARRRAAWRCA